MAGTDTADLIAFDSSRHTPSTGRSFFVRFHSQVKSGFNTLPWFTAIVEAGVSLLHAGSATGQAGPAETSSIDTT